MDRRSLLKGLAGAFLALSGASLAQAVPLGDHPAALPQETPPQTPDVPRSGWAMIPDRASGASVINLPPESGWDRVEILAEAVLYDESGTVVYSLPQQDMIALRFLGRHEGARLYCTIPIPVVLLDDPEYDVWNEAVNEAEEGRAFAIVERDARARGYRDSHAWRKADPVRFNRALSLVRRPVWRPS